jgi:uncharacterized YigZ family protein
MLTLAGPVRFEETIKRSRFIAHATRTPTQAESLAFFESVADPQATHNCWAWRIDLRYRFNDEGEPAGTAGRPILAAIEGRALDQVMIVVTRHYGGIKLGVGGLVRAYGGCASKCLDRATIVELRARADCVLTAGFAHAADIHRLLEQFGGDKLSETFDAAGLQMTVRVEERRLAAFRRALADLTQGKARLVTR